MTQNLAVHSAEKQQAVPPCRDTQVEKPVLVPPVQDTREPLSSHASRLPDIPHTFTEPQDLLGAVPVQCAEGFEVTRIPNTPEAVAQAKSRGQVVVYAGDHNPDKPDESLIRNEEICAKGPDGMLTYRGDLLVIWRSNYAQAFREQCARKAHMASDGVKIRRIPLKEAMHIPEELAELEGFGIRG